MRFKTHLFLLITGYNLYFLKIPVNADFMINLATQPSAEITFTKPEGIKTEKPLHVIEHVAHFFLLRL